MDMRTVQSGIGDPEIPRLLDNILDAVLSLKARLADSNRDSNSLGGILIPPAYPITCSVHVHMPKLQKQRSSRATQKHSAD